MGRWHLRIVPITVLWPSQQEDSPTSSTKPGASLPLAVATGTQTCTPLGTRSPVCPHGEWVTAAGTWSRVPRRNQLRGSAVARLASTRWHQCSSAMPTGMPLARCQPCPSVHGQMPTTSPSHGTTPTLPPRQGATPTVPGLPELPPLGAGPGVPVGSEQRCPPKQTQGTVSASFADSSQPQNGEEKGKSLILDHGFALYSNLNTTAERSKAVTRSRSLPGDEGSNGTLNLKEEPEQGG